MKVCYTLATSDLEGAARSMLDLIDCDIEENINVYVILPKHNELLEKKLRDKGIKYKVIFYWTDSKGNIIKNSIKKIIKKISIFRIKSFLLKNDIDIVHNNSLISTNGMIAAHELGIPYICHMREDIENGLQIELMNYEELIYYVNNANCVIAISQFIKKYFETKVKNDIVQIYDGIQLNNYSVNKEKIFKNKDIGLIIIGRISKPKGQFDVVKAVNELVKKGYTNYKLKIVGNISDNEYFSEIRDYININKLEKYIEYIPFTDDLKKIREQSDICLVCSTNEGLGRVTIEAMLSSELVIGADSTGTKELIEDGHNGFLYKSGDYKTLSEIIIKVSQDKKSINEIVKAGHEFAINNFNTMVQGRKVIDIYNNIMESKRNEN